MIIDPTGNPEIYMNRLIAKQLNEQTTLESLEREFEKAISPEKAVAVSELLLKQQNVVRDVTDAIRFFRRLFRGDILDGPGGGYLHP